MACSTPTRSANGCARCSTGASWICFASVTRTRGPFRGGTTGGGAFHKGEGLRIDLLLGTRALAERVREVQIDRDYRKKQEGLTASDHAPVIADLD